MSKELDDFLFGGGGKSAKFEEVGDTVEGTIISAEITSQTDMETGEVLTWNDGSPRKQLVVSLQTDLREGDEDDGVRRLYAKGGNYEAASGTGTALKNAIAEAVKKAGASSLDEGGFLKVGHTGLGKKTNRGFSAPKLYKAQYKAPTASVEADELFDD